MNFFPWQWPGLSPKVGVPFAFMKFAGRFLDLLTSRSGRWIFLILVLAVLAGRNLPWQLGDYDQAKQAFVSLEMVETGHWLFQHTPDWHVATKPPLIGWISAELRMLGLPWDFAWRLPGFLAALGIIALLLREGDRLWPRYGGIIAVGVFALNMMGIRLATLVRTDMPLTLGIFLLGWVIYRQILDPERRRDWRVGLLIFAVALFANFTKGPIFYVFLLPGLVVFAGLASRWKLIDRPWRLAGAWLLWSLPALLFFAAWAGFGAAQDQAFYEEVVVKEFLGRFTTGVDAVHNNQPIYFYLEHILHKCLPWSLFWVALPFFRPVRQLIRQRPEVLWLVCWAVAGFIAMSLVPSKRVDRIFPVVAPLALATPACLCALQEAGRKNIKALTGLAAGIALLGWGTYALTQVIKNYHGPEHQLVLFAREARAMADIRGARLGIVRSDDEGLLLYTRVPGFLGQGEAARRWNAGEIQGLLMERGDAKALRDKLEHQDTPVFALRESEGEKRVRYVLIFRQFGQNASDSVGNAGSLP